MIQAIKKAYPILDEKGRPCTFPTFASQVYMEDGKTMQDLVNEGAFNTPVYGVDYFNESDKAEILEMVLANFPDGFGLNFTVVGGETQPADPKENTVWIKTPNEITGWSVSMVDPILAKSDELYKDVTFTTGYYIKTDGSRSSSSNWKVASLIPLPNRTKRIHVRTGRTTATGVYHAFYDASNTFISSILRSTELNTYSVPDGAAYIELCIRVDDTNISLIADYENETEEGFVWVDSDKCGALSFNGIDKNEILVSPISCRQYIQGKWVNYESYIYKSGEWKETRLYLLNGNDECLSVTGGWERKPYRGNDAGSWSIAENGMTAIGGSPSLCMGLHNFDPTILSKFKTLRGSAEITNGGSGQTVFGIRSCNTMPAEGIDESFAVYHEANSVANGAMEFTVDISSITSGYPVFTSYNHTIRFSQIWLE